MLEIDLPGREAISAIGNTLLTPIIGHKGHPDIAIDADDFVQVVWDDTRGGKVEMVAPIDTSGSMNTEWADMCVVFYGGNFASGCFEGLKPMLQNGEHHSIRDSLRIKWKTALLPLLQVIVQTHTRQEALEAKGPATLILAKPQLTTPAEFVI